MQAINKRSLAARRSLDGLSLGDAFGQRLFAQAMMDPTILQTRVIQPRYDKRVWPWTDDTAMALSVVKCLEEKGRIDQDFLMAEFVRVFLADRDRGYGNGAAELLQAVAAGLPWRELTPKLFPGGSYGNGAAMRVAPLGAWFSGEGELDACVESARASAEVTHAHPEGIAGAIAVAVATAVVFRNCDAPLADEIADRMWREVIQRTPDSQTRHGIIAASTTQFTSSKEAAGVLGNGKNVSAQDTVPFALWVVARYLSRHPRCQDWNDTLWETASVFGDMDTTCAIVGGILGAYDIDEKLIVRRESLPLLAI